jgi:hypothetical protein
MAELRADPRACGPRRLGHRVQPGPLAAASRHQLVTVARLKAECGLAPSRGRRSSARGVPGETRVLEAAPADGAAASSSLLS